MSNSPRPWTLTELEAAINTVLWWIDESGSAKTPAEAGGTPPLPLPPFADLPDPQFPAEPASWPVEVFDYREDSRDFGRATIAAGDAGAYWDRTLPGLVDGTGDLLWFFQANDPHAGPLVRLKAPLQEAVRRLTAAGMPRFAAALCVNAIEAAHAYYFADELRASQPRPDVQ